MKKTLILWRHAQAEIGNDDFNRAIDERGIKESKIMSKFLLSNASPDLILSSLLAELKKHWNHLAIYSL